MGVPAQTISVDPSPPELVLQFDGNSIADSVATVALPVQPPNPAICVGNGFVVEVTNLVSACCRSQLTYWQSRYQS